MRTPSLKAIADIWKSRPLSAARPLGRTTRHRALAGVSLKAVRFAPEGAFQPLARRHLIGSQPPMNPRPGVGLEVLARDLALASELAADLDEVGRIVLARRSNRDLHVEIQPGQQLDDRLQSRVRILGGQQP